MIVQERGNGTRKTKVIGSDELGALIAESPDEPEKDVEMVEADAAAGGRGDGKRSSWVAYAADGVSSMSSCPEYIPKLVIILFAISALAVLAFYRNRGDTAALMCIEEVAKEAETMTVPKVDFARVKRVQDYTRHAGVSAEKWIVLSVSGPPTPMAQSLAALQGWQVVAVGTPAAPPDWRVANAIFLSFEQQGKLNYRITGFLPSNSYIRKNIGYLFAIQHGARKIYDADDSATLLKGNLAEVFDVELTGEGSNRSPVLQYRYVHTRQVVNPFVHFGQKSIWPRGLPLESVSEIASEVMYAEVTRGRQYIQQSLANGLPDVDSIFYFTRKSHSDPLDIKFDHFAPPVILPQGYMAPINALNTLFHASAFWALLLPVSVGTKTSDVMRGYWGQRLLWEVGGVLGVYPPLINRIDTLGAPPFEEEKDLHAKVHRLISFLVQWRSHEPTLFQKVLHLSSALAEEGFWTGQDVRLTAAWLEDLLSVGYAQPRLMALELDRNRSSWSALGHRQFLPHAFPAPYLGVEDSTGMGSQMSDLMRWRHFYGNIVLVLDCVGPSDHTVLGWRMLYGRLFKHIVILGPQADAGLGVEAVTGQSYKVLTGIFDRYPNADGFLMLKDEVVLNYWNLVVANKTKLWNVHKVPGAWEIFGVNDEGPKAFQSQDAKARVRKAFKAMPPDFRKVYRKTIGEGNYVASPSDVYYVPQRYVTDFITLINPLSRAELPGELAIPMIFLSLDNADNFEPNALNNMLYIDDKRLKKYGGDPATLYRSDVDAFCPWRATTEAELVRLFKTIGKSDLHLLDAFD